MEETHKTATNQKAKENEPEKKYTQKELAEIVNRAVQEALAKQSQAKQPILVNEETVTLMLAEMIADGTSANLGSLGQINHSFGTIDVPKKDFMQKRSAVVDRLLTKKKLIVLNGLTDEEMKRLGLAYREGEILNSELFHKLLDISDEELVSLFNRLCETHQRTIATAIITAYESGDGRVTLSKVKALNDASKAFDPDGMLTPVLNSILKKVSE